MSQIEVPDWVAADVLSRYSALRIERGDGEPWPPELASQQRQEDMHAALTAALGAMGIAELIETARTLSGSISFRIDDPRCELHCKLADALLRLRTKENADVS